MEHVVSRHPGNADRHFIAGWVGIAPLLAVIRIAGLVSKRYGGSHKIPGFLGAVLSVLGFVAFIIGAVLFIALGGL